MGDSDRDRARGGTHIVLMVDRGSSRQEHLCHIHMAIVAGREERSLSILIDETMRETRGATLTLF
jgi:hypothetical protein